MKNKSNHPLTTRLLFTVVFYSLGSCILISAQNVEKYISHGKSFGSGHILSDADAHLISTVIRTDSSGTYGGLMKTDTDGNIIWENEQSNHFNKHNQSFTFNIRFRITSNGGFITAGRVIDSLAGPQGMICRFDSSGNLLWCRRTSDPNVNSVSLRAIEQVSDHTFLVTGNCANKSGSSSVLLLKIDDRGNLIWSERLNNVDSSSVESYEICKSDANDYYIGGKFFGTNLADEALLLKVDSNGNVLWAQALSSGVTVENLTDDMVSAIATASDGSVAFLVAKYQYYTSDTIAVAYYQPDGTAKWFQAFDAPGQDQESYFLTWDNGDLIVTVTSQANDVSWDLGILAIDTALGELRWSDKFDLGRNEQAGDAIAIGKSLIIEAQSDDPAFQQQSIYFLKLNDPSTGCGHITYPLNYVGYTMLSGSDSIIPGDGVRLVPEKINNYFVQPTITDVCNQTGISPADKIYDRLNIFPNPANNHFTIQSGDPSKLIQSVGIYDLSGKLLREIEPLHASAISVQSGNLTSGIYLTKVEIEGKLLQGKLVLQ